MKTKQYRQTFAEGLCYDKLFIIFILGSIAGVYYEQILHLIKKFVSTGTIIWQSRSGVLIGPFNPLYGFGATLIIYFLKRKPYNNWQLITIGSTIGGTVEYITNYLQEKVLHCSSWNYSHKFLNIAGRTTIPFMAFWGLLAFIVVKYIYPKISSQIEKIPPKLGKRIVVCLTAFMAFNILFSFGAFLRQKNRNNNRPAVNYLEKFYDKHYSDEVMKKHFPNTKTNIKPANIASKK